MIIVKLSGGLGNQMFQYAAGVALSKKLESKLYMDLGWFNEVSENPELTNRVYELAGFGINPASISLLDKLSYRLNPPRVFREESFNYNPAFKGLHGNTILDGYWQSYKYFEDYREDILKVFSFPDQVSIENQELLRKVSGSDSISIHVRRGDYTTKAGRNFHGLIPLTYYTKALTQICKKANYPSLFIFSDDIEWCKRNVRYGLPTTYIDGNSPNNGVEDMRLMSACKHSIIANSSFSWWAAWLNTNPSKIVIAPKKWFADKTIGTKDLVPPKWKRI